MGPKGWKRIPSSSSDHLFGFPSKVESPDVLEPVRMSSGNDQAEERRLFYVAVTRAMNRLHLVLRKGLPSPYIAEIEGNVLQSTAASPSSIRPGVRFSDTFYVEQVFRLSDRQASAGIRQSGLLAASTGRFSFTSCDARQTRGARHLPAQRGSQRPALPEPAAGQA